MLVHAAARDDACSTSSSPRPGPTGPSAARSWSRSRSTSRPSRAQVFHVGAASCGVPGTPAGLERAARAVRHGAAGRARRAGGAALARDGVTGQPRAGVLLRDPGADPHPLRGGGGDLCAGGPAARRAATRSASPELGDALERLGAEGAEPFYSGEIARGGSPTGWSSAAGPRDRRPRRLRADRPRAGVGEVSRPPGAHQPAAVLGRHPDRVRARAARSRSAGAGTEEIVSRDGGGAGGAHAGVPRRSLREGFAARFLPADRLGSTTHITAVDAEACCASVTCSNGTGSGLVVPGTGVHVNNMLGEEDLNPLGFHQHAAGPADAVDDVADGRPARRRARGGPRQRRLEPDPLGDPADDHAPGLRRDATSPRRSTRRACTSSRARSRPSRGSTRRRSAGSSSAATRSSAGAERNVFFGGVHAVARDPATGELARRRRSAPRRRRRRRLSGQPRAAYESPTITRPLTLARSAISRERRDRLDQRAERGGEDRIRSGSERSSSSRCLVSAGSSTRAAIP